MRWLPSAAVISIALLAGCAGNTVTPGSAIPMQRDLITSDEIEASNTASTATAYDVVKKLRGNFLSYRGRTSLKNTSSPDPTVYLDEQAFGPISSLRNILASQIAYIRLYRSWEATTKYGMGNMGGVIAVTTKQ